MGGIKIYQASAGSGKTYTLARDYIMLLFHNHELYRNILAVTFTNKAAGEMKKRILEKLFEMSDGKEEEYTRDIQEKFSLSYDKICINATDILNKILHHYYYFYVQNIDSFFQKIIRGFVRELGLQYNYSLQLNQDKILNAAVDNLLIAADENETLRNWLVRFAESKMEEGRSWNLRRDILSLGRQQFSEQVKYINEDLRKTIENIDLRKKYLAELNKIKNGFENSMAAIGIKGQMVLEKHSLTVDDFFQKRSGPAAYFGKIAGKKDFAPNSYVLKVKNNPEKWVTKTNTPGNNHLLIAQTELQPVLVDAVTYFESNNRSYQTAKIILGQFYIFGIFNDLEKKIEEYSKENNEFPISEITNFLYKIIGDNDAPFIYEKAGSVFQHFLLDEFQDTSIMQWKSFKPLITNSIAMGKENLIVGDIKQSIYRWRNSDWKILGENLDKDFPEYNLEMVPLVSNYRSKENIVFFNNAFFSIAPELLQDTFNNEFQPAEFEEKEISELQGKIQYVYEQVVQNAARKKHPEGGQVKIRFYGNKEGEKWYEKVNNHFPEEIKKLLEMGVRPGDIAVLVRNKKDGKKAVDALMLYREKNDPDGIMEFPILSNESLYLRNSESVRFLVSFLRYLNNPDDKLNLAILYFEFLSVRGELDESSNRNFTQDLSGNIESIIFNEKVKSEILFLKKLSIPEILEGVVRLFSLGKISNDVPYIQAFLDCVLDYVRGNPGDISNFLVWWDDEGRYESLQGNDKSNSLQVLTIHKSKGLQFGYVFIPYADWSLDHDGNRGPILWCRPEPEPFNMFPILPVKYTAQLSESFFSKEYFREKLDSYIDNINLLYVAFTRAENGLWVYAPGNENKINKIENLIFNCLLNDEVKEGQGKKLKINNMADYWSDEDKTWTYGELKSVDEEKYEDKTGVIVLDEYPSWEGFSRMRLKYQGKEYFSTDKVRKMQHGTLLHELFELIGTAGDIDYAVAQLNEAGKIPGDEVEDFIEYTKILISKPEVKNWFDDKWEIKPEADILLENGKTVRPDRVMIRDGEAVVVDYKFGEKKSGNYSKQISGYIRYLKQMGYKDAKGYLWYVELDEIEEVLE